VGARAGFQRGGGSRGKRNAAGGSARSGAAASTHGADGASTLPSYLTASFTRRSKAPPVDRPATRRGRRTCADRRGERCKRRALPGPGRALPAAVSRHGGHCAGSRTLLVLADHESCCLRVCRSGAYVACRARVSTKPITMVWVRTAARATDARPGGSAPARLRPRAHPRLRLRPPSKPTPREQQGSIVSSVTAPQCRGGRHRDGSARP
jgi:hypothetical protein